MPPRERDGVFHRAEQNLRDARITFANGTSLEVPEIRAMSIEFDEPSETPIASIGASEATFSVNTDLNDLQDVVAEAVEEAARRQREAELQTLEASIRRLGVEGGSAMASIAKTMEQFYKFCGTSFVDGLNSIWESLGDEFELADEDEYAATDPISFDELMGGMGE